MEAHKLFSKLNIRDYNNELEKILDNKLFSLDVKNILLSMLYKIENAYKDYLLVKCEVISKKDFIEYVLKIIKEKCFEIEFVKIDDSKEEDIEVNKQKGRIKCYPNEKSLLSAIWYMGEEYVEFEPIYEYTKSAIQEMIYFGNNVNSVEVIRDFNGFSWDIVRREMENIPYNIIYQSLVLLYGKKVNYIGVQKELQGEEENKEQIEKAIFERKNNKTDKFQDSMYEACMSIYLNRNKSEVKKIENVIKEKKETLKLFQNKKEFIQKVTEDKKKYNVQIEKIDRLVNNTTLLREEYNRRNEKLPNKQKIFSISHLAERLEKEREELLEKIKQCNKMIEPKEYVKEKEKIEKEIDFLNSFIDTENLENIKLEESIIRYCNEFLKKINKNIQEIEEKSEILDWIYKIRYLGLLPFIENKCLIDVKELKENFKKVTKQIIKKAQNLKVLEVFADSEALTYEVLKELFKSRLINLENINIICKYQEGILSIEYYDGNILEKQFSIKADNIKIKKKIKLFI